MIQKGWNERQTCDGGSRWRLGRTDALWHLQQLGHTDSHLFEKESRVGGLTRSEQLNGFTFDYTGHLLHFKNETVKQLVSQLLDGNLHSVTRNSWIFSKGVYTRYPFQTNLYGLPPEIIKECILGFVQARGDNASGSNAGKEPLAFAAWIDSTLGPGIARHFMTPYNEKLWTVPLDELTCEWMGRFVPSTSLEQILNGALTDQSSNAGYNATFSYPLRGGIEALPQAFAASLTNIHTGCELAHLDLTNRLLHFRNGQRAYFHQLIATMPLPALLRAISNVPAPVYEAAQKLRFTSVCNVNLGVDRNISDKHWIYFPNRVLFLPYWLLTQLLSKPGAGGLQRDLCGGRLFCLEATQSLRTCRTNQGGSDEGRHSQTPRSGTRRTLPRHPLRLCHLRPATPPVFRLGPDLLAREWYLYHRTLWRLGVFRHGRRDLAG